MKYKPIKYREDVIAARERAGLTQVQAAEALGISESSWQKYELGERTPSRAHRWAIQRLLGIPVEAWGELGRGWDGARRGDCTAEDGIGDHDVLQGNAGMGACDHVRGRRGADRPSAAGHGILAAAEDAGAGLDGV